MNETNEELAKWLDTKAEFIRTHARTPWVPPASAELLVVEANAHAEAAARLRTLPHPTMPACVRELVDSIHRLPVDADGRAGALIAEVRSHGAEVIVWYAEKHYEEGK